MRLGFSIFTKEGRLCIWRMDMFVYVSTWRQAVKLILHDSGLKFLKVKFK